MYNLTIIYTEPFLFKKLAYLCVYAVTLIICCNFPPRVIFCLLLFLGMVMYANKVETKEK